MRYWWVNQNQTFNHEFHGGYLWSPKRKSNNSRNPFYEFMREVAPGDVIFSFADTYIRAIGIAQSHCYESPKPDEFGSAGLNWGNIGWKIDASFVKLQNLIKPVEKINFLRPLLPKKYSPLQSTGKGNQSIYLTVVPPQLATMLVGMIGEEAKKIVSPFLEVGELGKEVQIDQSMPAILEWEDRLSSSILTDDNIPETDRKAVILARRGQGLFKRNVQGHEARCRVTGVDRIEHLIASHCKPWRDCNTNEERLDGENGLLLTPSIDHLFDRGFISFESNGELLLSPVAHEESLGKMGIPVDQVLNVGSFSDGQKQYLEYHRENIFLEAKL